jgi:uncharacterized membrane protein
MGSTIGRSSAWTRAAEQVFLVSFALASSARAASQKLPYSSGAKLDLRFSSMPVLGVAVLYAVVLAVADSGATDMIPFVPLLNPLDVAFGFTVFACVKVARLPAADLGLRSTKLPWFLLLGGAFLWGNVALARALSNLANIGYSSAALFQSPLVQGAYAIFWSLVGVLATVVASRKKLRSVWVLGAGLLGLVVLKLFLVDLSASSAMIRIVTFLGVGLLLIGVGYLAPVPPEQEDQP